MYNQEHYIGKLERNVNAINGASENVRSQCLKNITWARELIGRLDMLDYAERQQAIKKIHEILDSDYQLMGFQIPKTDENEKCL